MTSVISFIPSIITVLGLCASLLAMYEAAAGTLGLSFGFALCAFICDILDGAIARRFSLESALGRILDSVADVPLYLLYPSAIVIALYGSGPIVLFVLACFVVCGIGRLVRFTREGFLADEGGLAYRGVPVYVTIPLVAVLEAWSSAHSTPPLLLTLGALVLLSSLMMSGVRVKKTTSPYILAAVLSVALVGAITLFNV